MSISLTFISKHDSRCSLQSTSRGGVVETSFYRDDDLDPRLMAARNLLSCVKVGEVSASLEDDESWRKVLELLAGLSVDGVLFDSEPAVRSVRVSYDEEPEYGCLYVVKIEDLLQVEAYGEIYS